MTRHELIDIIATPELLPTLSPADQGRIIRQARYTALLGSLDARIKHGAATGKLADHLLAARTLAGFFDTQMQWEIRCLERALSSLDGPVLLLKGAAYKIRDLGLARGRLASDVDLLLPPGQLDAAESLLKAAGWQSMKADEYEEHYYREWMHELPPLRHDERGTIVDLHHNILPPTARYKVDAQKLIAGATPIPGSAFYTLSPVDTVLHRSAHLFIDGDMDNRLRELVDLHGLLSLYGQEEDFRRALLPRASALGLQTPLYYALYFCRQLLSWEVPAGWLEELEVNTGWGMVFTRMLMENQLRSIEPTARTSRQRVSGWLLFLRSHWLRMPPWMLTKHLVRQAWSRGGLKTGK